MQRQTLALLEDLQLIAALAEGNVVSGGGPGH